MTTDRPHHHDDHLALIIEGSFQRPITTAEVAGRVDEIIAEFEQLRAVVHRIAAIGFIALGTALAVGIALVVIR